MSAITVNHEPSIEFLRAAHAAYTWKLDYHPFDLERAIYQMKNSSNLELEELRDRYRELLQKLKASNEPNKARSEERRVGKECRSRWSP